MFHSQIWMVMWEWRVFISIQQSSDSIGGASVMASLEDLNGTMDVFVQAKKIYIACIMDVISVDIEVGELVNLLLYINLEMKAEVSCRF